MVTKVKLLDLVIIASLVIAVGTFLFTTPQLKSLGFTPSMEHGSSNINSDVVLTLTSSSVRQPNDIYLSFSGLTSKNADLYYFDYHTGKWALWYRASELPSSQKTLQLKRLDPCSNAKWDGKIWETKILITPSDKTSPAVFTYTTADVVSSGYSDKSCWNPTQSNNVCHWKGKTLNYGDSVCMGDYLMVCYAGEAGTNALGFKVKSCSNGCKTEAALDSASPRGFCVTSPPYCYTVPNDATISESIDSTNCESRGGQWNWCQDSCDNAKTCYDGVQDQDETGVDCGGVCSAECPAMTPPAPSCYDGIQNQGEVGVDCGGPCDACETYPASPTCYDHIKNEGETNVDCGGPCKACVTGPAIRPATIPNQHDCVYQSLPTLTLSASKECPTEYICPTTQRGFFSKDEALKDCELEPVQAGVEAPSVLVNYPANVYRDASGNPICPSGKQPNAWEDVNNACMPKSTYMGAAIIFLIALFGYVIGKTKRRKRP